MTEPRTVEGTFEVHDASTEKVHLSETSPLSPSKSLGSKEAERLRKGVLIMSWISVVCLILLGFTTLEANPAVVEPQAPDLDALLDVLSSSVVIWRFISAKGLFSVKRERIACVFLGVLFIVSSIAIITHSVISLAGLEPPSKDMSLTWLFVTDGILCFGLLVAKLYFGIKLASTVIITDGFNSFIGMILSISILITEYLNDATPRMWVADPSIGIVCGAALCIYGLWLIIDKSVKLSRNAPDEENYEKLPDSGNLEKETELSHKEPDPDPEDMGHVIRAS